SFARKMRAEIEICEGEKLIMIANGANGAPETIFSLPKPENCGKTYVLEINNLDAAEEENSPEFIASNCANFTYLCDAVNPPQPAQPAQLAAPAAPADKPIFGLTYNFDFAVGGNEYLLDDYERCDSACCLGCEVRNSVQNRS